MDYKQCQNVFPNYSEWLKPEKMEYRRHFIAKIISNYDLNVLKELSELTYEKNINGDEFETEEWSLDLLGWMFCVQGPLQRRATIKGYKKLIKELKDSEGIKEILVDING